MSGPFKMKYTGENKSAFPFKENPLKMYGGMKASPARSWWNKIKNVAAGVAQKAKGIFGGGGEGSGGGEGGIFGMRRGGSGNFFKLHDRAHAGEGGGGGAEEVGQQGPQRWRGGGDGGNISTTEDMGHGGFQQWRPGG